MHENIEGLIIHNVYNYDFKADELATYGVEN
jgi:hypothetical protein